MRYRDWDTFQWSGQRERQLGGLTIDMGWDREGEIAYTLRWVCFNSCSQKISQNADSF